MADFALAAAETLKHEGGYFYNHTTGEVVNMGITLATLRSLGILHTSGPPLQSDIYFVKSLAEDEAKDIYHQQYWEPLHLDQINSQEVANKVFDIGVNMGVVSAARFLQNACGVTADGIVGPLTIDRANSHNPDDLLVEIRAKAAERYQQIASANPAMAGNLPGWLNRLNS